MPPMSGKNFGVSRSGHQAVEGWCGGVCCERQRLPFMAASVGGILHRVSGKDNVKSFSAINACMHIEGQRNAIDAQSAEPFLVLSTDARVFLHARPLPEKPQTLECRSALRFLHQSPADRV